MDIFPKTQLPRDFLQLLKIRIFDSLDTSEQIIRFVNERGHLRALTQRYFLDIDSLGRPEVIIRNLGWKNYRDRLGAIYLSYAMYKRFPEKIDAIKIKEVLDFEDEFYKYGAFGLSRIFMLGFYLKLASIEHGISLSPVPSVLGPMSFIKAKIPHEDWVIFLMWHFQDFLGPLPLRDFCKSESFSYTDLYNQLSVEQKNILVSNALTYAWAIDEKEIFVEEISMKVAGT